MAAAVGIGSYFWLREQARLSTTVASIETGPPAGFMLDSAAVALKYGGLPALREIVSKAKVYIVYVVDHKERELLGRTVTPVLLAQARRELGADRPFHPVRELTAPDGQRLLVFVQRHLHSGPRLADAARNGAQPGTPPASGPGGPGARGGADFARGDGARGPPAPSAPAGS